MESSSDEDERRSLIREAFAKQLTMGRFENNVVNQQLGYAYIGVPKAANTAVKIALLSTLGRAPNDKWENGTLGEVVHRRDIGLLDFKNKRDIAAEDLPFIFTVVRNPWDRLVSCFKSKVDAAVLHPPFQHYGFWKAMPFADFANAVASTEDKRSEIHFRSQWSILTTGSRVLPHYVMRLEHLPLQWQLVQAYFRDVHAIAVPDLTIENKSRSTNDDYRSYYTPKLKDLVWKRYKRDVDFLGYHY